MKSGTKIKRKPRAADAPKLGRKPKPPGEKKVGWARRLDPKVIAMIPELSLSELKSDVEMVEDLIKASHRRTFPEKYETAAEA